MGTNEVNCLNLLESCILSFSVPCGGGIQWAKRRDECGSKHDWDNKKCIHHITKKSFAPHLEYANVDPPK